MIVSIFGKQQFKLKFAAFYNKHKHEHIMQYCTYSKVEQ